MKSIRPLLNKPWLYLAVVIIGIALKFYGLESKYFWYDEVETIMHTSGISDNAYPSLIPVNEVRNIRFYRDLLHLNKQDYTVASQLGGLFSMPQLAPLHPALLIFWHRIAGDELIHYRLFNLFIFLLTLPFLFLLCKTLFQSDLSGWIAICLFSVSPFFNIYTQEARYIMVWVFFVIVSHYVFLQAIHHNKLKWWILYSIVGILAMYTSLLNAILFLSHFIYVVFKRKELWIRYSICLLFIMLAYSPWVATMFANKEEILRSMYWHKIPEGIQFWVPLAGQGLGFAQVFASFEESVWVYLVLFVRKEESIIPVIPLAFSALMLVLITVSAIYLIRKSQKRTSFYLMLITLVPILFIYILDIIRNGAVSFIWRYQIMGFVGILLIVAYYLFYLSTVRRILYLGFFIGLTGIGIASVFKISGNKCWTVLCNCEIWENYNSAKLFSASDKALLITDFTYWAGIGGFLEVMANSTSDNIDVFYASPDNPAIKEKLNLNEYADVYIVHASGDLVQNLKSQYTGKVDSLDIGGWTPIWRIEN